MAKNPKTSKDNSSDQPESTYHKLKDTPFKLVKDLELAEEKVKKEVWKDLTRANFANKYIQRPEFKEVLKELEAGVDCGFGGDDVRIGKFYSHGNGIKFDVNPKFEKGEGKEKLIETFLRVAAYSFHLLYTTRKNSTLSDEIFLKDSTENEKK